MSATLAPRTRSQAVAVRDAALKHLRSRPSVALHGVHAAMMAEVDLCRLHLPHGAEIHVHSLGIQIAAWGTFDGWPVGGVVELTTDLLDGRPDVLCRTLVSHMEDVLVPALNRAAAAAGGTSDWCSW